MICRRRSVELAALAVAAWTAVGCGPGSNLAPVQGQVTIDGQPYPRCKVIFTPVASGEDTVSGRAAFGRADDQGRFALTTYDDGDGALVGLHRVTLFRVRNHEESRPDLADLPFKRVSSKPVRIEPGENEVELAFTSDEIRRRGNRL